MTERNRLLRPSGISTEKPTRPFLCPYPASELPPDGKRAAGGSLPSMPAWTTTFGSGLSPSRSWETGYLPKVTANAGIRRETVAGLWSDLAKRRIIPGLSRIYFSYGISTAWTIWFESSGIEFWYRHIWRGHRVLQGMGCERCCRSDASGGHLPRSGSESIRYRGCVFKWTFRDHSREGDCRSPGKSPDLDQGDIQDGARAERSGIIAPSFDPSLRSQSAAAGDGLHRHLSSARL